MPGPTVGYFVPAEVARITDFPVFAPPSILETGQVAIGAVATLILAVESDRYSLVVKNIAATDIYVGPAGVTIATGIPLVQNESIALSGVYAVYAVAAAAGTAGYAKERQ